MTVAFKQDFRAVDAGQDQRVIVIDLDERVVQSAEPMFRRADLDHGDLDDLSAQLAQRFRHPKRLMTGTRHQNSQSDHRLAFYPKRHGPPSHRCPPPTTSYPYTSSTT